MDSRGGDERGVGADRAGAIRALQPIPFPLPPTRGECRECFCHVLLSPIEVRGVSRDTFDPQ